MEQTARSGGPTAGMRSLPDNSRRRCERHTALQLHRSNPRYLTHVDAHSTAWQPGQHLERMLQNHSMRAKEPHIQPNGIQVMTSPISSASSSTIQRNSSVQRDRSQITTELTIVQIKADSGENETLHSMVAASARYRMRGRIGSGQRLHLHRQSQ